MVMIGLKGTPERGEKIRSSKKNVMGASSWLGVQPRARISGIRKKKKKKEKKKRYKKTKRKESDRYMRARVSIEHPGHA